MTIRKVKCKRFYNNISIPSESGSGSGSGSKIMPKPKTIPRLKCKHFNHNVTPLNESEIMSKPNIKNISKHGMTSELASEKKRGGHKKESVFNEKFGNKDARINYSRSNHDCEIISHEIKQELKVLELTIDGDFNVSLKSGSTIQFHLGTIPELSDRDLYKLSLYKNSKGNTCGIHSVSFSKQCEILKSYEFWHKYLHKGNILCYVNKTDRVYIFFNMVNVIKFIISSFTWRTLETGRIKGDFNGTQVLTFEYRQDGKKNQFALGATGSECGNKFIEILKNNLKHKQINV